MVCRENKGRSAVMGYQKHLLRQLGYSDYDDFEVQSGIHEFGHQYEGFPRPTKEEQLTFLRGLRQQIELDPKISNADKYRESHRQPGMVTRIDQEMTRLKTGKDENGRPLTPAQLQRGQDLAAMQRMSVLLKRNQEAKDQFFDVYARGMGVSAEAARNRWKSLVRRQASERENTKIRLTDSWRDTLAVSGFTSRQQADIGQSNVAREAMRIMEEERKEKLASLPTRPALTSAQRVQMAEPGKGNVQCVGEGGCGQFGHERADCPNQSLVEARDVARDKWSLIAETLRRNKEHRQEAYDKQWAVIIHHDEEDDMRAEFNAALKQDQQITQALADGDPGQGIVKCTVCAQFGHLGNECPNEGRAAELEDLRKDVNVYQQQVEELADTADEGAAMAWRDHLTRQFYDKRAEIAAAALRCMGGCGQFGHTREDCPNAALLDEVDDHRREIEKIREQARQRAELRGQNPDTAPMTDADSEQYDAWFSKSIDIDQRLLDAGLDPTKVGTVTSVSAQKPSGPASARIQEVAYNPDSGYLEVTTRPYTRKRDGKVMDPKTYAYRMSPGEYKQMMAASSLTSYVSQSVWAKNGDNAAYQFENTAEAAEASVQRKCATCGRWASMTSAHTCPVAGSRAGQDDSARRARVKAEKQAARAAGRPVQMPPQMAVVPTAASLRFANGGGQMHYADRSRVDTALAGGKVAGAQVRASFLDATVSGQAIAWNDADGQAKLSTNREDGASVQCNCRTFKKNSTCKHIELVGKAMASRYGADHPAAGSPLRNAPLPAPKAEREETAKDAPEEGFSRATYEQISARRASMRGAERGRARQSAESGDGKWLRATGAIDARTGKEIRTPQSWSENGISASTADKSADGSINLSRTKDVQEGLRAGLRGTTGKHWSVTRRPGGWMHITTARQRSTSDQEITMPERVELAKALKMPVDRVSAHGVAVPPDNGWRAEFLDRTTREAGPRVLGERFVARADQRPEMLLNL